MPRHKKKKQALFDQQNGSCALCNQPIPQGPNQICYYEPNNVVVCRTCNTAIYNYVRLKEPGGVTITDMETFLAREPAPEPTVVDTAKHKELTPGNLKARLAYAQGKLGPDRTVADYDKRFGSSGPVIDPDTGLEWVPTPPKVWVEPAEPVEPVENIVIDGVVCDGLTGVPLE